MDARRPVTMQQTPPSPLPTADIHLCLLPLLLTQIIVQGNWVDYLPSQSVITSPLDPRRRPSTCLRSLAANSHEAFKCQVTLQLTTFPMTRLGRSKITRGKPPPLIYGAR